MSKILRTKRNPVGETDSNSENRRRSTRAGNGDTSAPRDTAERIHRAAEELFCRNGYDAVSVNEIADAAGVQKPLVFYHHGSKEKLFEKVLERYYAAHHAALASAYEQGGRAAERMHRMIDAYASFITENVRYAALIQREVGRTDTHPLIEKNFGPLFKWIEQALEEITPRSGPLAAQHFFVTFSGIVINYFTYAPLLASLWRSDPLSPLALDERRAHLHWMVDVILAALEPAASS